MSKQLLILNTITTLVLALKEINIIKTDKQEEKFKEIAEPILTQEFGKRTSTRATAKLEDYTKVDENGKFTHVLCGTSKVWFPATIEYFYEDKTGKSKVVLEDGTSLRRLSRMAEKISKDFSKWKKAETAGLLDDLAEATAEDFTELQSQLANIKDARVDYTSIETDENGFYIVSDMALESESEDTTTLEEVNEVFNG